MLTFPGICSSISLKEIVICKALIIDHIWLNDPDKITWIAILLATEDWPKVCTVEAASSTFCMVNPSFTYLGKTLVTFRSGSSISWPVSKDAKYFNEGGNSCKINLSRKPASLEIKRGFSKTNWIKIESGVIFLAYHTKLNRLASSSLD